MRVVFVHGACVKGGPWWWHRTAELLAERDVASEAPALPSCGETGIATGAEGPGLAEDVAAVRDALTAGDEPTVVVAHSYGGIIVAEAAAGVEAVRHLLLVSSYLPEVGQSLSSFGPEDPAPFLDVDPDAGTFTVRSEALAETFLQDCDAEIQRQAVEKIADQSVAVLEEPVQAAAWQQLASTYLVCADDRGTPVDRQRDFARRADSVVEFDAGHHPFLSQPERVRDLVLTLTTQHSAEAVTWQDRGMERVLGIGGYFLRANDPTGLSAWYRDCLGLEVDGNGVWEQAPGPTVFAAFEAETDYLGSRGQQTMLNLRVRDLDAMLSQLRAKGADVDGQTQDMEGVGRFGWVTDPEGNRVELWQPA